MFSSILLFITREKPALRWTSILSIRGNTNALVPTTHTYYGNQKETRCRMIIMIHDSIEILRIVVAVVVMPCFKPLSCLAISPIAINPPVIKTPLEKLYPNCIILRLKLKEFKNISSCL